MKRLLFIVLFLSASLFCFSQETQDSLTLATNVHNATYLRQTKDWTFDIDTTLRSLSQSLNIRAWNYSGSSYWMNNGGRFGLGTSSPNASSLLDITSTTQGFLAPRMNTTQQNAISSPATGLLIYNTDSSLFRFYNGGAWVSLASGSGGGGGTGTVTSVATTDPVSGGTITTTGTISLRQSFLDSIRNGNFPPSPRVGTYATRIALSPTNGTEFFQTNDGRDAPAGRYFYLDTVWNFTPLREEAFWYYFNDFSTNGGATGSNFGNQPLKVGLSGTGATISFTTNNNFGLGLFSTGSTTAGYARLDATDGGSSPNAIFRASQEDMYYKLTITSVSQKSDLSNVFNIDAGFVGGIANPFTSGYYFRYDSTTSPNWLYRNGNNALASTGVAFAASTAYTLEVFVRSDSVFYYINGTNVISEATVATTTFYFPETRIIKTSGGTAVTMGVDYLRIWARLTATQTRPYYQ